MVLGCSRPGPSTSATSTSFEHPPPPLVWSVQQYACQGLRLYLSLPLPPSPPCVECATVRSPGSPPLHHLILLYLSLPLPPSSLPLCGVCNSTARQDGRVGAFEGFASHTPHSRSIRTYKNPYDIYNSNARYPMEGPESSILEWSVGRGRHIGPFNLPGLRALPSFLFGIHSTVESEVAPAVSLESLSLSLHRPRGGLEQFPHISVPPNSAHTKPSVPDKNKHNVHAVVGLIAAAARIFRFRAAPMCENCYHHICSPLVFPRHDPSLICFYLVPCSLTKTPVRASFRVVPNLLLPMHQSLPS